MGKDYSLLLGDTLEQLKQLPDKSVQLVVTSPPYPGVCNMWGDLYKPENFIDAHKFLSLVWDECLRILDNGCKMCINIANTKRRPYLANTAEVYQWAKQKCEPLGEIIWNKGYGQNGTAWGSYCNPSDMSLADQHEYILIFRKPGERKKQSGYFINPKQFKSWRNSCWQIAPAKASDEKHIAPFPIEIPKRLILLYSYPDETILDPFSGSGTTGVASINFGRKYIGIDHNEEYIKLSENNIEANRNQMELYFEEVANVKQKVNDGKLF